MAASDTIARFISKVEGSNKFSKAISFGHSQEFLHSEKEDQEITEACRLDQECCRVLEYLYPNTKQDYSPFSQWQQFHVCIEGFA